MRVLHAMAGAERGGAERFFERLVVGLQDRGLDQRVLVRPYPDRSRVLRDHGIDPVPMRFGGRLDFTTPRRFAAEVAAYRPDVVLTWMNRATRFCDRAGRRKPFVHVGTPRGYYDPKYFARCDHMVCATDDLAAFYTDREWPAARVHVIPNFIAAPTDGPTAARAAFETPDDAPLLLTLGRLHTNKAFDVLIAAMAELPDCWLWIGGVGPLDAGLRDQAARLGVADRVRFLGWQEDIGPLFRAADMFVCPSRHEPFGNIVIESWVYRVPIVAAASQGPSALISDGVDGLLVPIDDSAALAAAIKRVRDDTGLAARLCDGGWRAYQADYTAEVGVGRYLDLFERVAG